MSIKSYITKINDLLEKDFMAAQTTIQNERTQLLATLESCNVKSQTGANKAIKVLEKLNYLHTVNVQDISSKVLPIIIDIFNSPNQNSLTAEQLDILVGCIEINLKYAKLYKGLQDEDDDCDDGVTLNSSYSDFDYCRTIAHLAKIVSKHVDLCGNIIRNNFYDLFLDPEYKFLNGYMLDEFIEIMIGENYDFMSTILNKLVENCLRNSDNEEDLVTINAVFFLKQDVLDTSPLVDFYFENNLKYLKLLEKIANSTEQTLQSYIFLANFAHLYDEDPADMMLLAHRTINIVTQFLSSNTISDGSLFLLLEIMTNQQQLLSAKTIAAFYTKIDSLMDQSKHSKMQQKLLKLISKTVDAYFDKEKSVDEESVYKLPHYSKWSLQWEDLIYHRLNDEKQDSEFVKWVMQSTDIPIGTRFLQKQYQLAPDSEKPAWSILMGNFGSAIDKYIFNTCGVINGMNLNSGVDKEEHIKDDFVPLSPFIQKRLVLYDVGVLYDCPFFKINYIHRSDTLRFVVGNCGEPKTAEVFISGFRRVGVMTYQFTRTLETFSEPILVDIKIRTADDQYFCKTIEYLMPINKMFIESEEMTKEDFAKQFGKLSAKNASLGNDDVTIKKDYDQFIISLNKLKKFGLKVININNDLYYAYATVATAQGKIRIFSRIFLKDSKSWEVKTVSTIDDKRASILFNKILSVS